eukprot:156721_1
MIIVGMKYPEQISPMTFNDAVMHCRRCSALVASVRSAQQNMNAMRTCSAMAHTIHNMFSYIRYQFETCSHIKNHISNFYIMLLYSCMETVCNCTEIGWLYKVGYAYMCRCKKDVVV